MLFQLHWQKLGDPSAPTRFVAQGEANTFDEVLTLNGHFANTIRDYIAECPDGWGPLVMDENCSLFVRPVSEPTAVIGAA